MMGYFPNGTAGMDYEAEWCDRCIHHETCPILVAHSIYNYKECNNRLSILHILIPIDDEGDNEKCTMFLDETLLSPLARAKFRSADNIHKRGDEA
jgi:hypothetical protein